jgi:hypothetical protein
LQRGKNYLRGNCLTVLCTIDVVEYLKHFIQFWAPLFNRGIAKEDVSQWKVSTVFRNVKKKKNYQKEVAGGKIIFSAFQYLKELNLFCISSEDQICWWVKIML